MIKAVLVFTVILLTGILAIVVGNPPKKTFELNLSPTLSPILSPSPAAEENLNKTDSSSEFASWKLYSDQVNGYEYRYPASLDIVDGDIRMSVAIENTDLESLPLMCPSRSFEGFSDELEGKKISISGIQYCEYTTGEGAAGTIIEYSIYTTVKNKTLYAISISAALRNCENFCTTDDLEKCKKQPDVISCTAENNIKLDLAKKILSTFKFIK